MYIFFVCVIYIKTNFRNFLLANLKILFKLNLDKICVFIICRVLAIKKAKGISLEHSPWDQLFK